MLIWRREKGEKLVKLFYRHTDSVLFADPDPYHKSYRSGLRLTGSDLLLTGSDLLLTGSDLILTESDLILTGSDLRLP